MIWNIQFKVAPKLYSMPLFIECLFNKNDVSGNMLRLRIQIKM